MTEINKKSLGHPGLERSLQLAYSAERAAAYAYIGHGASLKDGDEIAEIRQIEQDEWDDRENVLRIMMRHGVPVSRWLEFKYGVIGRIIGLSCHVIGRFMPFFFAGRLESGNVCEYIRMMRQFRELGIPEHDEVLYEMGIREKEHEDYFLEKAEASPWMKWFEVIFEWGRGVSYNDLDANAMPARETADQHCANWH